MGCAVSGNLGTGAHVFCSIRGAATLGKMLLISG
jgi:hypothetical protein